MKIADAAEAFLASRRIAVTGVSRNPSGHGSNAVFDRLLARGYEVFPVNPHTDAIGEHPAFPDLTSIPGGVDAVVIATSPRHALSTMQEAADLGITQVWLHRSLDAGSVDPAAVTYGRQHGITVIDGGCPLTFGTAAHGVHKLICAVLTLTGAVPRVV